ncbi:MAG: galactitol-1-phosphate 5-dehydrogenase [Lachnospiraceae bacterium]|nr:galactitol-1-phosphate 5-dehydrogenase [Lachnospiraceae bacterium]
MRAYVLNGIGDIALCDVAKPELDGSGITGNEGHASVKDEDCVILKVRAAGICGSDIPRIYKTGAYHHPLIPGHEFSGEVIETGKNVHPGIAGKRVGVFPLIPCMSCLSCRQSHFEMCKGYNYLGSRCDGGFAEYVKVPAANLLELPDEVSFEQAAMLEPMAVSVHSVRQCGLDMHPSDEVRNMSIAVCGMGTIGLLTVAFLKGFGYENVFCIGNKPFQKEMVTGLGIPEDHYLDSGNDDPVGVITEMTDGAGVSYYFECVGRNESVSLGLNVLGASGRLQLVGNPASDMLLAKEEYWKILRKQFVLTGTWNSSYTRSSDDDWHMVTGMVKSGKVSPERLITHLLPFEELGKGFEMMRDRSDNYVKVMCRI